MDNQAMSEIVESVVRRVISSQTRSAAVPDMTLDLAKRLIEKGSDKGLGNGRQCRGRGFKQSKTGCGGMYG